MENNKCIYVLSSSIYHSQTVERKTGEREDDISKKIDVASCS